MKQLDWQEIHTNSTYDDNRIPLYLPVPVPIKEPCPPFQNKSNVVTDDYEVDFEIKTGIIILDI